jgi:hypothetical protein
VAAFVKAYRGLVTPSFLPGDTRASFKLQAASFKLAVHNHAPGLKHGYLPVLSTLLATITKAGKDSLELVA